MSVNRYNPETGKLERIAGGTVYADAPIGAIQAYGGAEAPRGWLLCDGSAVSRTAYSELFAKIGTAFGPGDGSTTFNVPDLREAVPVGAGESTNENIADHDVYDVGEFKDDQEQNWEASWDNVNNIPSVSGGIIYRQNGSEEPATNRASGGRITISPSLQSGVRTGTTTHGKQLGVNFIIKAENIAVPHDFAEYIRLATAPDWSNAVQLTAAQLYAGYTAPAHGLIVGVGVMPTMGGSELQLSVNGVPAIYGLYNSSGVFSAGDAAVPVAKDDVVKISKSNLWAEAHISFVPYKVQ